ncbi:unnamed protein product [Rotaria sp. Silwood1]|nr:unnamed protein product [Rotaria sp. Silwood1]CAF1664000.1 unnamed protein product [Rotaria sp. Silwood1]CAF3892509.1 unnamed protein product [Rotaria sp. Silwood1]CAF4933813.1 unnamed protein product [Rotaria sp. Silwood1]
MTNDFIYSRTQSDFIDSIVDTVKQRDGYLGSELLNIISIYKIDDIDFNCYYIQPNLDQQLINDKDFI